MKNLLFMSGIGCFVFLSCFGCKPGEDLGPGRELRHSAGSPPDYSSDIKLGALLNKACEDSYTCPTGYHEQLIFMNSLHQEENYDWTQALIPWAPDTFHFSEAKCFDVTRNKQPCSVFSTGAQRNVPNPEVIFKGSAGPNNGIRFLTVENFIKRNNKDFEKGVYFVKNMKEVRERESDPLSDTEIELHLVPAHKVVNDQTCFFDMDSSCDEKNGCCFKVSSNNDGIRILGTTARFDGEYYLVNRCTKQPNIHKIAELTMVDLFDGNSAIDFDDYFSLRCTYDDQSLAQVSRWFEDDSQNALRWQRGISLLHSIEVVLILGGVGTVLEPAFAGFKVLWSAFEGVAGKLAAAGVARIAGVGLAATMTALDVKAHAHCKTDHCRARVEGNLIMDTLFLAYAGYEALDTITNFPELRERAEVTRHFSEEAGSYSSSDFEPALNDDGIVDAQETQGIRIKGLPIGSVVDDRAGGYSFEKVSSGNRIAEQQFAQGEKLRFSDFTSCIGVVGRNGDELTGAHLVMFDKTDRLFDATAAKTAASLFAGADETVIFGYIDWWRYIEGFEPLKTELAPAPGIIPGEGDKLVYNVSVKDGAIFVEEVGGGNRRLLYPDCDGDGVNSNKGVSVNNIHNHECRDGQGPDGGWSEEPGKDENDEDADVSVSEGEGCPLLKTSHTGRLWWPTSKGGFEFKAGCVYDGPDGVHLTFQDGQLKVSKLDKTLWTSNSAGRGHRAFFQGDGNLVVYSLDSPPVLVSNTHSQQFKRKLVLEEEGLSIRDSGTETTLWRNGSQSGDRYTFVGDTCPGGGPRWGRGLVANHRALLGGLVRIESAKVSGSEVTAKVTLEGKTEYEYGGASGAITCQYKYHGTGLTMQGTRAGATLTLRRTDNSCDETPFDWEFEGEGSTACHNPDNPEKHAQRLVREGLCFNDLKLEIGPNGVVQGATVFRFDGQTKNNTNTCDVRLK